MKIRARDVADKIAVEEKSLKYFIIAWVIFIVALTVRLALSIQQYVEYQSYPLLQPVPYVQRPQNMPYVVLCYDSFLYTLNTSYCINQTLTAQHLCSSILLVPTEYQQCVLFNTQLEVQTSEPTSFMNAILIVNNFTDIPVSPTPTLSFITGAIMNTSDYISNLANIGTVIPLFADYPVFVGIQKQEVVALNGSTTVTYTSSISNAPFILPPASFGPNAYSLQIFVYFTSFTVNSVKEVNPLGIFDIFSSLGGIYSIIGVISGVLFITNIKAPNRKFVLQKEKPTEKEKSTEDSTSNANA